MKVLNKIITLDQSGEFNFEPIINKAREENDWEEEYAREVFRNFCVYIAIAGTASFGAVPVSPIDEFWHTFILHTRSYARFCKLVFNKHLHHQPGDGSEETKERFSENKAKTGELFEALSGKSYFESCDESENNGCSCDDCSASCDCCP